MSGTLSPSPNLSRVPGLSSRLSYKRTFAPWGLNLTAPSSTLATSLAAGAASINCVVRLDDEPYAIRVAYANDTATPYTVTAVAAACSTTSGDQMNPTGGTPWALLGTNGLGLPTDRDTPTGSARSLTVAGNGGSGMKLTWTDWTPITTIAPTDGLGGAYVFIRTAYPINAPLRCPNTNFTLWNALPAVVARNRFVFTKSTPADIATAPLNTVSQIDSSVALPGVWAIQVMSKRRGITILASGDSTTRGDTTTGLFPYVGRAAFTLSTPALPVSYVNAGWGAGAPNQFLPIAHELADVVTPQILAMQIWTGNGGATDATNRDYYGRTKLLGHRVEAGGGRAIEMSRFPRNSILGAVPAQLAAADALMAEIRAAPANALFVDATTPLDSASSPGYFKSVALGDGIELSNDGTHPNDAGHDALMAAFIPFLRLAMASP